MLGPRLAKKVTELVKEYYEFKKLEIDKTNDESIASEIHLLSKKEKIMAINKSFITIGTTPALSFNQPTIKSKSTIEV